MTIGDYMTNWLSDREDEIRQRTREGYADLIVRYIAPLIGAVEVDELTPEDVGALLDLVVEVGHTRTAELLYVLLRAALTEARPGLMKKVQRPVHVQNVPEPWNDAQMAVYHAALAGHRHEVPLSLALLCGLRRGEICGLRWRDVDLRRRTLTICNQRQRMADGRIVDCAPKSRAGQRVIPFPDKLLPVLRGNFQLSGYVCTITPQGLDRAHARLVAALGLPRIPLHGLRHSMATACVRHGGDLRSLQLILGHAQFSTTATRYTHPDLDMLRGALACAGGLCYNGFGNLTLNQGVQGSSP